MELSAPLLDVTPGVRGLLLQELARLERPVSRRELATIAGVAPSHASVVLGEQIGGGLVSESPAGRASMVELNRGHLAAAPLLALAGLRGELVRRLRARLSSWSDIRGAWLFGSVARGDASGDSDVDVLIVADDLTSSDLHERLAQLHADVQMWTGNVLQIVEHTPQSWGALKRTNSPLSTEIRYDGVQLADGGAPVRQKLAP